MFARIARIVVLGLALTVLGGNGMAAATGVASATHTMSPAGENHCC